MSDERSQCGQFGGRKTDGTPCDKPAGAGRDGVETGRCSEHVDGLHGSCLKELRDRHELTSPEEGPVIVRIFKCSDHGKDVFQVEIPRKNYRTDVEQMHLMEENGVRALVWPFDGDQYNTVGLTADDFNRMDRYMDEYKQNMNSGCLSVL